MKHVLSFNLINGVIQVSLNFLDHLFHQDLMSCHILKYECEKFIALKHHLTPDQKLESVLDADLIVLLADLVKQVLLLYSFKLILQSLDSFHVEWTSHVVFFKVPVPVLDHVQDVIDLIMPEELWIVVWVEWRNATDEIF